MNDCSHTMFFKTDKALSKIHPLDAYLLWTLFRKFNKKDAPFWVTSSKNGQRWGTTKMKEKAGRPAKAGQFGSNS